MRPAQLICLAALASCGRSPTAEPPDAGRPDARQPVSCATSGFVALPGVPLPGMVVDTRPGLVSDHHGGLLLTSTLATTAKGQSSGWVRTVVQRFDAAGKPQYGPLGLHIGRPGKISLLGWISPSPDDRWMVTSWEWDNQALGQLVTLDGKLAWAQPVELGPSGCFSALPDGSGGFVVLCGALTMQRLSATGQALWPAPKQIETGTLSLLVEQGDGAGGIVYPRVIGIPVAESRRNSMITIQHIDAQGQPTYSSEGRPITGKDRLHVLASSIELRPRELGVLILQGEDARVYNGPHEKQPMSLFAARVDLDGHITWPTGELVLLADTQTFKDVALAIGDGQGGLFTAWQEDRDGDGTKECYAQRVFGDGSLAFPLGGVLAAGRAASLCQVPAGNQGDGPLGLVLRLGDGFAVLYAPDGWRAGFQINGRIAAEGYSWDLQPVWSEPVILTHCPPDYNPNDALFVNGILTDGVGGMWVQWEEGPSRFSSSGDLTLFGHDIRLQRISGDGKPYF